MWSLVPQLPIARFGNAHLAVELFTDRLENGSIVGVGFATGPHEDNVLDATNFILGHSKNVREAGVERLD